MPLAAVTNVAKKEEGRGGVVLERGRTLWGGFCWQAAIEWEDTLVRSYK
jgi:hypothetical protein